MTRHILFPALLASLVAAPGAPFAAGFEDPKTTQTAADCTAGQVYDTRTKTCVAAQDSRLTDQDRMEAAYDLAHGGRVADAILVLAAVTDQGHPDVLTLRGFATRKSGDWAAGVALYEAALAIDPEHWQARAYMGMGLAEKGRIAEARAQLDRIRASGGRGSYPEQQLARMLETGDSPYSR